MGSLEELAAAGLVRPGRDGRGSPELENMAAVWEEKEGGYRRR